MISSLSLQTVPSAKFGAQQHTAKTISALLLQRVEDAQARLDPYGTDASGPLTNDAIYLVRVMNVKQVCDLIGEAWETATQYTLGEIINKSIKPNKAQIEKAIPFVSQALDIIIEQFEQSSLKAKAKS